MNKRKELLETSMTEEKNVSMVVANTVAADNKFLKRAKRDIEDSIEDLGESLKQRLSQTEAIDKSVVEVQYQQLASLKAKLELYKEFERNYLSE